jgi:hypothetical protein
LLTLPKQIQTGKVMIETISLDAKTIIVKAKKENDLSDVMDYITKKIKRNQVISFLKFTSSHSVLDTEYNFNREDCHDR